MSNQRRQFQQLANAVTLQSVLLVQKILEASGSKVRGAFGSLGGVNLRIG